ncbi:MAG TPA: response regulator [Anaerolineaceae bacterium]
MVPEPVFPAELPQNVNLPEDFLFAIKQILERFYDFPFLNAHPLAKNIRFPRVRPSETDGQRLRRIILAVLEELKPASEAEQKSLQSRYYSLLNLRYVESNTMQQVARELGISERQAYRDLKRAEDSLAVLLWEQVGKSGSPGMGGGERIPAGNGNSASQAVEIESIELHLNLVSAQELLQNAVHAVERLSEQQGVTLYTRLPPDALMVYTDPRLAQQILINLISHILQQAQTTQVDAGLSQVGEQVVFEFCFSLRANQASLTVDNPVTLHFIKLLGWRLVNEAQPDKGAQRLALVSADEERLLLAIDDHPPLIELIRRYLTPYRCQVIGASNPQEGLMMASSLHPDVILLDVMMPDMDGWNVLQRLRNNPELVGIPVVICSIFNDPGLAYSLGASAILPKPVKREQLIEVLQRIKVLD